VSDNNPTDDGLSWGPGAGAAPPDPDEVGPITRSAKVLRDALKEQQEKGK